MEHGCRMLKKLLLQKCASTDHRKHETRPKRAAAAPTIDNLHARTPCPARQFGSGSRCGNANAKAIFPPRAAQTSGHKYSMCRQLWRLSAFHVSFSATPRTKQLKCAKAARRLGFVPGYLFHFAHAVSGPAVQRSSAQTKARRATQ